MSLCNVTVSITLSHYPTRDPTRREQGPINSRGVTVFTTDYFFIIIIIVGFTTLAHTYSNYNYNKCISLINSNPMLIATSTGYWQPLN